MDYHCYFSPFWSHLEVCQVYKNVSEHICTLIFSRVLTVGDMLVIRDERFDLRSDHDLVLTRVTDDDGGDYSCEIEADAEYPIVITHRVEVLGE